MYVITWCTFASGHHVLTTYFLVVADLQRSAAKEKRSEKGVVEGPCDWLARLTRSAKLFLLAVILQALTLLPSPSSPPLTLSTLTTINSTACLPTP